MRTFAVLLGLSTALYAAEVNSFLGVTCEQVGDYVISFEGETPVMAAKKNGSITLTFTSKPFVLKGVRYPGGYKTVYSFGGTMKHEPLKPDYCIVDISGTAKTAEAEAKAERLKMAMLTEGVKQTV